MIGVVLIAHGQIGQEMRAALENMLGSQDHMATVSVVAGAPLASLRSDLMRAVNDVSGDDEGVLILADIFGGTPCNIAAQVAVPDEVKVLTGLNLPMLVSVARARKRSGLTHVAQSGLEAGQHYIGFAEPTENGSGKAAAWVKG